MNNRNDWVVVSSRELCPVCLKGDWCGVSADGAWAICMRIADGAVKETRNGGFLHRVKPGVHRQRVPRSLGNDRPVRSDLDALADHYRRLAVENPQIVSQLAKELGIHPESLHQFHLGWSDRRRAFAFPMRDAALRIVGIRLRRLDGSKYAVRGSRDGLFLPEGLDGSSRLLVAEGPTDAAALSSLGFPVVGRPSCKGGTRFLVDLVKEHRTGDVVVVADGDAPGKRGAEALATALAIYVPTVRVICPPGGIKDARAWVNAGAKKGQIESAISRAPSLQLQLMGER